MEIITANTTNERPGLVSHIACHFCDLEFDVKKTRSLRAHIEEVHVVGESGYMCGMCCEEFSSKKAVEAHMSTFHRVAKPFGCGICGETFRVKNMLVKHIDSHTQSEVDGNTVGLCYCGECFEFFDSVTGLHAHTAVHREQCVYVCGVCGLQSQHRHVLVKHLECHIISSLLSEGDSEAVGFKSLQATQVDRSRVQNSTANTENSSGDNPPPPGPVISSQDETLPYTVDIVSAVGDSSEEKNDGITLSSNEGTVEIGVSHESGMIGQNGEETEEGEEDDNTSYKCGVCSETFPNLVEALGHAETHNEEDFNMLLEGNDSEAVALDVAVVEDNFVTEVGEKSKLDSHAEAMDV